MDTSGAALFTGLTACKLDVNLVYDGKISELYVSKYEY